MVIERGRYFAELLPSIVNVSREENVYRIVVRGMRAQSRGKAVTYCINNVRGLDAAKEEADRILNVFIRLENAQQEN